MTGCGDRDADLPDDDRREQGRCHRPETDPLEGEAPEIVPEAEREEDRDLRILTQGGEEPLNQVALRLYSSALVRRLEGASSGPFPALSLRPF